MTHTTALKKEKKWVELKITRGVKRISGILKTDDDYKVLREQCLMDKLEKYDSIARNQDHLR